MGLLIQSKGERTRTRGRKGAERQAQFALDKCRRNRTEEGMHSREIWGIELMVLMNTWMSRTRAEKNKGGASVLSWWQWLGCSREGA